MKVAVDTEIIDGRTVVTFGESRSADNVFVVPQGGDLEIGPMPDPGVVHVRSRCRDGVQIAQPVLVRGP